MKKIKILFLTFIFSNCALYAQQEFSKWFININTGIDFATNPPSSIGGFSLNVFEGVASISDSQGNLLFYSNGSAIYDASHNPMVNGSGLIGNISTTQSALIVKQPGNNTFYYVFTLDEGTASNQGAYYSVVDMSLAAGMGSVVTKNIFLYGPNIEKQIAVRHCNGKDIWIVSHEANNNNFRSYLLTSSGLNPTPVISSTGIIFYGIGYASAGEMKGSPDGTKIGWATPSTNVSQTVSPCGFYLYDFDASTGAVSNPLTIASRGLAYGVEFSPDGTKLYGTQRDITSTATSTLCQWDICQTNTTAIISSLYTTTVNSKFSAIQRGIDNKLYLVNGGATNLSVIHNPNNIGSSMNLAANSLTIGGIGCGAGLPNYVTGYTKPQNPQITYSLNCQKGMFNAPSYTFSSGCTNLPFPVNAYLWDFGDVTTGAANSSTLANASHDFTNLGTYTVSLIVYSNCENDTIKKILNITSPSPTISVAGTFTICKGDKRVYTASGGTTYLWNNSVASPTIALSPNTTSVCYVTGASSIGCTANKQFTITVNPCINLPMESANENKITIWPNPFSTALKVQATESSHIELMNVQGVVLMDYQISSGLTELDTSKLPSGYYIVRASNKTSKRQTRLVKLE